MKKKGISAIVATVLIILITVAAVTIIWAAIIPMVNDQLDTALLCSSAVQEVSLKASDGYTCIVDDATIRVQIERGSGDVDLADIQVLVSTAGSDETYRIVADSVDYEVDDLPGVNEVKTYLIDVTSGASNAESVAIASIVSVGSSETVCDVSASVALSECTV